MKRSLFLISILSFFVITHQRSTPEDDDFIMGIVEFTPELPTVNWSLRTVLHFENYTRIISEAAQQDVDILIFPEYTLNNVAFPIDVPNPADEINPCLVPDEFDNLLVDLSCLARENGIYLCINISEKEECTEELQEERDDPRTCSSLGINRYNTNVIFDRNGAVIGRYRKFNLFREGGVNTTFTAELSTFTTDFGVTFGNIICFDVLFHDPAMQLVRMGVKNFIFPAMWISELPFLTSNQIFQSWAFRNNVNLFASGTNFAPATATGSGFFLGRWGDVFTVFSEDPLREFYAMRVPKDPSVTRPIYEDLPDTFENSFRSLCFGRDFIDTFETELIDLNTQAPIFKEICHDEHCCSFVIDISHPQINQTFQYRYVAFNGFRTYSGWGEKKLVICAIMLCNDESLDSCGRVPNYNLDQVTFNTLEISTTFNRFGVLMMPNSLDMNMNSFDVVEFTYDEFVESVNTRFATISLLKPHSDIQAFALYGHDYETEDEFDFNDDGSGSGEAEYIQLI